MLISVLRATFLHSLPSAPKVEKNKEYIKKTAKDMLVDA